MLKCIINRRASSLTYEKLLSRKPDNKLTSNGASMRSSSEVCRKRQTNVIPDAVFGTAYGIEGTLYLQWFYMSDDVSHHKQRSPKNHKNVSYSLYKR